MSVTSPILVTGGTGTLGRHVVPLLHDAGHRVRILSRHPHDPADGIEYVVGDLSTGEGADHAVEGVDTIIHCAGSGRGDGDKARHLVRAAVGAGRPHVIYISVVGAERVPVVSGVDRAAFGYFASKRAAETVIENSGLPWSTLRATQFHDLILMVVRALAKLPVIPVPSGTRFQPVDTAEVAARLVELALGSPAGLVPDLAGPRAYPLGDLARGYLRAAHKRSRPVLPMRMPGRAAKAIRAGANLPLVPGTGKRTWEDFLADHLRK